MNSEQFYNTITPESLNNYAAKAGLEDLSDLYIFKRYIDSENKKTKVLEIGCATGRIGFHLIQCSDYTGIDMNKDYIDFFKKNLHKNHIHYKEGQIREIDFTYFTGEFDIIIFPWAVIGDFQIEEKQYKMLEKVFGMISENGVVMIDFLTKEEVLAGKGNHSAGYSPCFFYHDEWIERFEKIGFTGIEKETYTTSNGKKRDMSILKK